MEREEYSSLDFLNFINTENVEDDDFECFPTTFGETTHEEPAETPGGEDYGINNQGTVTQLLGDSENVLNPRLLRTINRYSRLLDRVDNASQSERPEIQNIVSSAHVGIEIDLREVAISTRNAEYNPRKFHALILRLQKPKCTGLLFRTGRFVVTGARSFEKSRLCAKRIAKLIRRELGVKISFKEFKVENVIASFNLNTPIRLEQFYEEYKAFCNYEPELFAGLVYRFAIGDREAVLLIFVSGNIIITGCRSYEEICFIHNKIVPLLRDFRN